MSNTTEPRLIARIRRLAAGLSGLADISTADLDKAAAWCVKNGDDALLVDIDDEIDFRNSYKWARAGIAAGYPSRF